MAYNLAFTISTTSNPSQIVLTNTSTGSDGNLINKIIYLYQANSELLVAAINWPLADNSITLDVLQQDYALNVQVVAVSSSPLAPPSSYTYQLIYAFTGYGEAYYYSLTQRQTSKPNIVDDTNWYNNKMILRVELDSAVQAINVGNDLYGAQSAISRYQYILQNDNYYF